MARKRVLFMDNECVAPLDNPSSLVYSLPQARTQEPKFTKAYLSHRQPLAAPSRDYRPKENSHARCSIKILRGYRMVLLGKRKPLSSGKLIYNPEA
ncbi:hypothetical protein PanWU01x14_129540 [Parasponia andersonii]|uniref:Uncharacterized protein n=1 Tax=Parasponia andersonii TaxID=3476 RepID=A0A2P5CRJ4_PARAD|nr:hypothetical protein PanWU01x14_129540 [Parasponia andersonii]